MALKGSKTDQIWTAHDEGFDEIADWFETTAKAGKSHGGRFQEALGGL